jgi:hypothetical protein
LQAWKASRAIGTPNGLGSIHDALQTIDGKLDDFGHRLDVVERKVL